jgi:hypothetical protein
LKLTADPLNVPFVTGLITLSLPCGTPHRAAPVYFSEAIPVPVSGVNGPFVSVLVSDAPACSVSGRLKEAFEVFGVVSGVHVNVAVPVAAAGFCSTLHPTAAFVVSFAVYFADVNASPEQPVKVPLTVIVWTAAVFVNPGFSVTVPLLAVQSAFTTV